MLKKSIQKTKSFFLETLQNLRSFLFGGYEKFPTTLVLNPLSCSSITQRSHELDPFYAHFTSQPVPDHHDHDNAHCPVKPPVVIASPNLPLTPSIDVSHNSEMSSSFRSMPRKQLRAKPEKDIEPTSSYRFPNGASYLLAQKMKELEMMDLSDVDHSLDVEEALHYYSRLTCPVYVDIVNKFFMDMYAEFLLPQPSISRVNSSSRRLGPLTL